MPRRAAVTGSLDLRAAISALIFFCAYLLLARFCYRFVIPPFMSSVVWFPGGLTLGALLLVRREHRGLFLAVTWLAELLSVLTHGDRPLVAPVWATGATLRTGLGVWLVSRWAGGAVELGRLRDLGGLLAFGVLLAPLASATLGTSGSLLAGGELPFWRAFVVWWSSDAMGTLLCAPLVLSWLPLPRRAAPERVAEWLGLMLAVGLAAFLAFSADALMVLPYVPLLTLIAAGIRLGPRGAATGLVVLGAIAILRTHAGHGLYGSVSLGQAYQLLSVQVFLAVAAVSVLGLAAALQERKQLAAMQQLLADAAAVLSESLEYRETFQRTASLVVPAAAAGFGAWVRNADGRLECVAGMGLSRDEQRRLAAEIETAEREGREPRVPPHTTVSPLIGREGRLGALALRAPGDRAVTPQEVALARDLARRFAAALEHHRLVTELARVARLREDFIMVAAHELRTPITPLLLQLQRLRREASSSGTGSKLDDAVRYVKRLSRLIDVLISATDAQSGRLRVEQEPLDLAELVRDVVEENAEAMARAGCTPVLRLHGEVRGRWDRARLEEVIATLLSNAIKFGAGKRVEIEVGRTRDRAWLRMRDHGIGIPPELMERIFSPFEQGVAAREYGGLGLGLYLAREVVEAHGGTVRAVPTRGGGATFVIELPALPDNGEEAGLEPQPAR